MDELSEQNAQVLWKAISVGLWSENSKHDYNNKTEISNSYSVQSSCWTELDIKV